MSEKFNKLLVIVECESLWSNAFRGVTIEATFAWMLDIEPADKSAPRNPPLYEVFDDAEKYCVYRSPAMRRRIGGRGRRSWMENRFNSEYHSEVSSDPAYDAVHFGVLARFNDLVRRAWTVRQQDHERSMVQATLDMPIAPEKQRLVEWELIPYNFTDWSYIRESRDPLPGGHGHVTMVHCRSLNDVLCAYVKYANYTSLGKTL